MARDYSRSEVLDIIEAEARERGIPRDDFLRFAYIETGGTFDEAASRGPRGAKGLFQFVPSTARAYGIEGRELDPVANTDAAARLYLENQRVLTSRHRDNRTPYLSGQPSPDGLDMYLAHQQGAGGYASIQAALANGRFSRADTRDNILNNVSSRDIERVTGTPYNRFVRLSDRDLANVYVRYWDTKFDRIHIPEKQIEPVHAATPRAATPQTVPAPSRVSLDEAYAQTVRYDHVRYGMGDKDAEAGTIDCSGWVVRLQNATMAEINREAGQAVFSPADRFDKNYDAAATIVQKASRRSGAMLEGAAVTTASLREGMVIGEDNGPQFDAKGRQWDAGRFKGIDHITMVVRDPHDGKLMISQSRGGEGVEMIPLDRYLQSKQSRGVELYATDPLAKARDLIQGQAPSHAAQTALSAATHAKPSDAARDVALKTGDKGQDVTRLQETLRRLGYRDAEGKPLVADGDFGDRTRQALQAFQREHGLKGLGIAGPKTQELLQHADRQLLTHPGHPQHARYQQVLDKVHAAEAQRGIKPGLHSEQLAGALTVEVVRERIERVDRVELNTQGTLARVVQVNPLRDEPALNRTTDAISTRQASLQPIVESSQQTQQVATNVRAQQQEEQRLHAQTPKPQSLPVH
jgi:hypothetical protein